MTASLMPATAAAVAAPMQKKNPPRQWKEPDAELTPGEGVRARYHEQRAWRRWSNCQIGEYSCNWAVRAINAVKEESDPTGRSYFASKRQP